MAYNNPFFYNKDLSVDSEKYSYTDATIYKAIYGSSVSYVSRLNYLETVDNALKILPASENNLTIKYNLKFLLNDLNSGNLLKTIEIAGGYRYLKFKDPSNFYLDMIGFVEDYSINKISTNLNEISISISSYVKAPIFKWRTSCLLNNISKDNTQWKSATNYLKGDFVYNDFKNFTKNKIDNFWFATQDIPNTESTFSTTYWTKNFNYDLKLPFELNNSFDIHQLNYKNSYIQNIKHKDNSNSLKQFNVKLTNITDRECRSVLFFLEKKCGYRRFIYEFPIYLKNKKVFICTAWNHTLKFLNCNDIDMTFVEDPNPNIFIDNSDVNNPHYYVI